MGQSRPAVPLHWVTIITRRLPIRQLQSSPMWLKAHLTALSFTLLITSVLFGQESQSLPELPNAPSATRPSEVQGKRTFLVLPGYHITDDKNAPPLNGHQKWHLWVEKQFDPFELIDIGIGAGIAQAQNDPESYGQGMQGYGKRYGVSIASEISNGFFASYLFPTVLHEDPRYFRMGDGPKVRRVLAALSTNVVTKTDGGHHRFNFSRSLGALVAAGISNAYYPVADRGASETFQRASMSVAFSSVSTIGDEFWPDIRRMLFERKRKTPPSAPPASPPQD